MLLCPYALKVWSLVPSLHALNTNSGSSIGKLLQDCLRMVNLPHVGVNVPLYPWVLWLLWTSRNQFLFEDKSFSETEVIQRTVKCAKEWQEANLKSPPGSVSKKDCTLSVSQNNDVAQATHIFSDAAWNKSSGAAGLGWVCTTSDGSPLFTGFTAREIVASALPAEALALKAAIADAISHGIKDLICFSDSKSLITFITGNKSVIPLLGILHDIGVLSRSLSSISFVFVPRCSNTAADCQTKEALFLFSNSLYGIVNSVD